MDSPAPTAIDQLATALSAAQAEMPNAAFNRMNPHFKSEYADLASIREATLPALTKHGLSISQYTRLETGGLLVLYTLLMHKSGQFIYGTWPITPGTPQNMGSQLTYFRRYEWSSIIGVASDDDDDAEVAEAGANVPRETGGTKSAYRARKDKIYEQLEAEIKAITSEHALKVWGLANAERIGTMPDNWRSHFRQAYDARMTALREGVTEDGKPVNGNGKEAEAPEPGSAG